MRYTIHFVIFLVSLLAGCLTTSTIHAQTNSLPLSAKPAFQSILITNVSSVPLPKYGRWQIGATPKGDYLDLSYHELPEDGWATPVWNIVSIDNWQARSGWFVFIESESKAWAYDGDQLLILVVETPNHKATYSGRFPSTVPTEVFSRLSETAKKNVKKHE